MQQEQKTNPTELETFEDGLNNLFNQFANSEDTVRALTAKNINQSDLISRQNNQITSLSAKVEEQKLRIKKLESIAKSVEEVVAHDKSVSLSAIKTETLLHSEKLKNKDFKEQLKAYKSIASTPQKLIAKIRDLKDKAEEKHKGMKGYQKQFTDAVRDIHDLRKQVAQAKLYYMATYGDYHLMLWPSKMEFHCEDKHISREELAMLVVHKSGNAKIIYLKDNELTAAKALKGGMRLPKAMEEFAESWLIKVKSQNWQVENEDLVSINNEEVL